MEHPLFRSSARSATLVIPILAILCGGLPAHASDKKIIPPSTCQIASSHSAFAPFLRYDPLGRIENHHNSRRITVVCPIVRDNTQAPLNYVRVYFEDSNNLPENSANGDTGVMGCRLRSVDHYGRVQLDTDVDSTNDDPNGVAQGAWVLYVDETNNGGAFDESMYTLTCYIPPLQNGNASSIGAIVIEEP